MHLFAFWRYLETGKGNDKGRRGGRVYSLANTTVIFFDLDVGEWLRLEGESHSSTITASSIKLQIFSLDLGKSAFEWCWLIIW
jgi:hypothetical protein